MDNPFEDAAASAPPDAAPPVPPAESAAPAADIVEEAAPAEGEDPPTEDWPVRTAAMYENERYSALSRKWSAAALLPTDRCAFSTVAGKASFRTRAEMADYAVGADWSYGDGGEWAVSPWEYARDFSARGFEGDAKAGPLSFARRRRLSRTARYANERAKALACRPVSNPNRFKIPST